MDINEFYDIAKSYAIKIRDAKPEYCTDASSTMTLIITDANEIVTGITSIKISNDDIVAVPSENIAVANMFDEDKNRAKQMITISLVDDSIVMPCSECLTKLYKTNHNNGACEIIASESEIQFVSDLIDESVIEEKKKEIESLGTPADFASGFEADESNPFLDSESADAANEVPTLQYSNENPQGAFGGGMMPQGYPQPGYPQGAFGGGMMPQGYPQPGMFNGQPGYPQGAFGGGMMPNYPQGAFGGGMVQGYPQGAFGGNMMPNYPQGAFGGGMQQGINNQNPYMQSDPYKSLNVNNNGSTYQEESQMVSQYLDANGSAFKKKLNGFLGTDQAGLEEAAAMSSQQLSTDELKKLAKEKKKAAKMGNK